MMCFVRLILTGIVIVLLGGSERLVHGSDLLEAWKYWQTLYAKTYTALEEPVRFRQWLDNVAKIQDHNLRFQLGLETFDLRVNQFTDLTWSEFQAIYLNGPVFTKDYSVVPVVFHRDHVFIPDTLDWREEGHVRRVKDQGQCGSCWAFSATGAIEGQYSIQFKSKQEISEQQLIDCSRSYGNFGCNGGFMNKAYEYAKHFGLESETKYPYKAEDGRCKFDRKLQLVKVSQFEFIQNGNETALMQLVATGGPVSVGIDADDKFMFYSSGIYTSSTCSSLILNHGVLVVGYGNESGKPYWIVKNSWGISWGEDGYIRMARDRNNMCGIASYASLPHIIKA